MNFYKGMVGRWVSGFGLLMALSGSVLAQGPWDFNGTQDGWIAGNSSASTSSDSIVWDVKPGTSNWNKLTNTDPGLDPRSQGAIVALTLKNDSANTNLVIGIKRSGIYKYKRISGVPTNQTEFSTQYVDVSSLTTWVGTNGVLPKEIMVRMRQNNDGNDVATGNVYIDKIEMVTSIPNPPTMTIASSTSGVTDGSTTSDSSIGLTFTSSESTTDFAVGDITFTGGSLSSFAGSGTAYTATFTPSASGATTIDVAASTFTDSSTGLDNTAADQFNWTYSANNIPVISLTGSQIVEVALGDTYTDAGATASDVEDGNLTTEIVTVGASVNTSSAGTYAVTYDVSDDASAAATQVVRTVIVAPFNFDNSVESFQANNYASITAGTTAATYTVDGQNNFNNLWTTTANIETTAGDYVALTIKNGTLNTRVQVVLNRNDGDNNTTKYKSLDGISTNDSDFKTYHIDMGAVSAWTGTVNDFGFRFKKNTGSAVMSGDILIDKIAIVPVEDVTAPSLSNVSIFSNNSTDTLAKVGDVVTLSMTANEPIKIPVVTFTSGGDSINDTSVTYSHTSGHTWTAAYTVESGDTSGAVGYSIAFDDTSSNTGTAVTSGSGSVSVDKTAPTLATVTAIATPAADATPSFIFSSDEAGTITTSITEGFSSPSNADAVNGSNTITFNALGDGTYSGKTVTVTDATGNASTSLTIPTFVIDTTGPTMTIGSSTVSDGATSNSSSISVSFTANESTTNFAVGDVTVGNGSLSGFSGSGSSYSATVTPSSDDVVTINVGGSSFTDALGNNNSAATQFGWTYDGTAPVISLSGQSSVSLELGTAYTDAGATATDSLDGTLTSSITTVNPVDVDAEGTYTVTYNVSDGAGNAANQVTRTVTITPDVTVPVITLTGNASVNVLLGNTYTDAGATATDNTDGTITGNISTANPVDVNTEGTYTVTYDVSDAAGNAATQVTRTVTVTSSPIMTISSSAVSSGGSTNTDPIGVVFSSSKTTTDFSLSDVSVSGGALSNLSGSDKTYTATFTASGDGSKTIDIGAGGFTNSSGNGNVASEQFSYTYDSTFPTLDTSKLLLNISEGTTGLGRIYADESVTWSVTGDGVSVNSAGSLTLSSPADFSVKTSHSFTVKGTDAVGNSSSVPVTVEVDDISSPVLDYSGLVKSINDGGTALGTITADEPVTWSIAGSGVSINQSGEVSLDSPADFLVAQSHEYRVTATDKQGGAATIAYSFIVEVIDITAPNLDYSGLVTSIDDGGTALGIITADEPVTWSISGSGVSISTAGVVTLDSAADFLVAESHEYRVTAKDKQGGATKIGFKFIVEVIDVTPPEFDYSDLLRTVDEGTTALGTIKANEPVNWTVSGTGVSIDSEGAVTLDSPAKWEDASYHTYKVTATDKQGGAGRIGYDFTANVNDKTAPVITLVGDSIVNIELGTEYTDAGATAVDNKDGTVTDDIVTVSKVNTDKVGTYTVTYNVTDAAGNVATEVTRTVTVTADATKPVITLNSAGGEPTTVTTTTFDITIPVDKTGNGPDGKLGNATNDLAADNVVVKGSYVSGNLTFVRPPVGAEALSATWGTAAGRDLTRVGTNLYFRKFTYANAVLWCESVNGRLATAPEVTEHLLPKVGNNGDGTWETDLNWPQQAAHYWTSTVAGDNTADPANRHKAFITYNTNNGNSVHAMQGRADTTKYWPLCVETGTTTSTTTGGEASPTLTHEQGTTYTDAGATAVDNIDGDITANIVTVNPVDSSAAGIYVVTYNVSDAAGNRADEVTRTVTVSDTQVPVITLTGAQSASVEVGYSYVDAGATASDVADGDLTASITTVSDVDTSVVGTYTVTYNVSDAAGNVAAQVTRTVQVTADVTVPVITLIGSNVSLELGSIYTDAGATASDNIDGDISATIVTVSDVNTGAVGTYTVTYNVSDAAGNAAVEVTRTVTVTPDVTIPVITLLGDASVSLELGTVYTDAGATALDNIDGDISASITAVSTVDINTAGTYSVTYSVSDASGNAAAEVSRSVTITPDATKPTITLVGDATVELVVGRVYTDAGATATDNIDGNITASIVVVSTVDANTVGTYTVTYGVSDAAGNAADEVTRTVIVSPFIINLEVPADLVVDATGYLTAVDLGTATATDGDGNAVSVSADQTGPFESGAYTITWTATDADGNTTSETQSLKVNPLANLSPSRSTAEGATPEVKVQLSGMAPTYPVVVPFSISGTATEGDDYTVTQSGSISIAAGSSGVINLTIANDEVAESDETVVITITDPSNAALGSVTQQTLTIVDGNVPPAIELSVSQGDVVGSSVVADLGAVVISVSIDDPNPTDSHTVDWGDGLNLPGAVADPATKTLSFSAAGMVGVTTITADVSDGTDSVMASVSVNVLESAPILASDVDSDGDGISDAEEGYGDSDGDGIPDYADNITVPNAAPSDGGVVETEPGTQITLGSLSLANGDNDISVTEDDLVELGIEPDADFDYPAGLIDFTISGAEPGASYNLVVPLAISIPANSEYRKYFNEDIGWRAFATVTATGMDPLNSIASALAVDGACPGIDSDAYVSGVNAGDNCLRLTIEDGGPNDVDMTANGTVVDPGGIASFGDGTAPVITLLGDASVSVEVGNAYVDAGATAEDAVDGDISASITADSSVDVDTVGTYTVTYNVSDAAGNAAVEVTRTVSVVLGTPSTSSTAVLSRSGLIANGTDSTTVTVTALNDQGGALRQMTVSGSFGLGSVSAFTEQGDGVYTATVTAGTSIGAGPVTVTITNGQDSVSINSGQIQIRAAEKPRSSGGGGCAVATDGSSDSSLVLVLMLLGMLMLRRRKRSS